MTGFRRIALSAAIVLPCPLLTSVAVGQQTPAPVAEEKPLIVPLKDDASTSKEAQGESTKISLGGTPAFDIIQIGTSGPGQPLRRGNVIPKSEKVFLNGSLLEAGKDYAIDYASGVVYLQRSVRTSDSLSVQYRYDNKPVVSTGAAIGGNRALQFGAKPGQAGLIMGLGATERTADGKVMRSNVVGAQNNFSAGAFSLKGAYFSGSREQANVQSGYTLNKHEQIGTAESQDGSSQFLVQQFRAKLGSGTFTADVQDVSKNYVGFDSVKAAGFSDAEAATLQRERGLKRQGFAYDGFKVGKDAALGFDQRTVSDDNASLVWNKYTLKGKTFAFEAGSQSVGQGFTRFNDIREGDRAQLQKEQGMSRNTFNGSLAMAGGTMKIGSFGIDEMASGMGIEKREISFETKKFGFSFGEQTVDKGFTRFGSLPNNERAIYGLEAGLNRQWMAFNVNGIGKDGTANFTRSNVSNNEKNLNAETVTISNKSWSLNHISHRVDQGFGRLGSLQAQERTNSINQIARMYGGQARPEDQGRYFQSDGIDRNYTGLELKGKAGAKYTFESLNVTGAKDRTLSERVAFETKNLRASMRRLDVGKNFGEITRLMTFEQAALGAVPGLRRLDTQFAGSLRKGGNFAFSQVKSEIGKTSFDRTNVSVNQQNLQMAYSERKIEKGFNLMAMLGDAEMGLLNTLNGFSQKDGKLLWTSKTAKLDWNMFESANGFTLEDRRRETLFVEWQVDPTFNFAVARLDAHDLKGSDKLLQESADRISFSKKLGKTTVAYASEGRQMSGLNATATDSRTTTVAVETQVSKATSVRTEQTSTQFADGTSERLSANTVNSTVTKNFGVSITDVNIDRHGDDRDEVKRDYGFWYDFGKGVRLSYGFARQMSGLNSGQATTVWTFGQNAQRVNPNQVNSVQGANVNGTNIGFGSGTTTWDSQPNRTQAFTSLQLSNAKPFGIAPLGLKNTMVNLALDQASDNFMWLRENQLIQVSSMAGKYALGYEYRGQVDNQGQRAADRTFHLKTDPSEKLPWSATAKYKARTLPDGRQFAIRDITWTYRMSKMFELSNSIQTNPEQPNPNVILGSLPLGDRRNEWKLTYKKSDDTDLAWSWQELLNDSTHSMARTAGLSTTLFKKSGSPLTLYYGIEQSDAQGVSRAIERWHLQFDQRPGPNQVFSLFLGNLSYQGQLAPGIAQANNWTVSLNYQLRFK